MRTLLVYLVAGAVYVGFGVLEPDILLSWVDGAGYLLVAVWIVPALATWLIRRLR